MTLKELIKNYRHEKGLSQRQFALACGLSNGYISMLEKGINPNTKQPLTPSLPALKKIAQGMGLTMEELFSKSDDMSVNLMNTKNPMQIGNMCSIGDLLRSFRNERAMTLGALATQLQVTPEYLNRIEAGRILPSLDMVDSIISKLEIPFSRLHNNRGYMRLENLDIIRCKDENLFTDPYSDFNDIVSDDGDADEDIPYQYRDFFLDALSDDEINLLFSFARLNHNGRIKILEEIEKLTKSSHYQRVLP